jgi:hypothetical protein
VPLDTAPRYAPLMTTRRWVAQRLPALAANLLGTAPVRDGFLFPALSGFYDLVTGSIVDVQRATRQIVDHLDLPCEGVVVGFVAGLDHPAHIEQSDGGLYMEIASEHRRDARALGAILAHECAHLVLAAAGVPRLGNVEDEVHVDLAAILGGLGPLILNAWRGHQTQEGDLIRTWQHAFGYLPPGLHTFAHVRVARSLGLDRKRILAPLEGLARRRAAAELILSWLLPPAPVAYAPPDTHAVTRCPTPGCLQRLRVPVGKVGSPRCPSCGQARPFDASATRIAPALVRTPVQPGPPPPVGWPPLADLLFPTPTLEPVERERRVGGFNVALGVLLTALVALLVVAVPALRRPPLVALALAYPWFQILFGSVRALGLRTWHPIARVLVLVVILAAAVGLLAVGAITLWSWR